MLADFVQLGSRRVGSLPGGSGDALSSINQSVRLCNRVLCFANAYFQAKHLNGNQFWRAQRALRTWRSIEKIQGSPHGIGIFLIVGADELST